MRKISIIICSLVIFFLCFGQDSTAQDDSEDKGKSRQTVIVTDKKVYWPGEEIVVTLKNNSNKPVYYTDSCDISLCWYDRDEWMCEVTDCIGKSITLQPDTSREIKFEGFLGVGRYRYKWLFTTDLSGDTSGVTIFSDEFDIQLIMQPDFE